MGNEKDPDIVDISDEIKDVKPEEGQEKKTGKEKKSAKKASQNDPSVQKEVSVREFRTQKKKGLRKALIIIAIILAVGGFITYKVIEAKNKLQAMMSQSNVQTAKIERRDISKAISTTGTIQSKDVRTITSPLAGVKIDQVNCKVGDIVQAGTVVVTFSREDINKKIGQLEEDITEAKQAKALDSGDRNNTYVGSYDTSTYNVANAYDKLLKAEADLQKAKDDMTKACNDKAEYKDKYQHAKDKIDEKKRELEEETIRYKEWRAGMPAALTDKDDIQKDYEMSTKVNDIQTKVTEYETTIKSYDSGITTYENSEISAQKVLETAQRNYDSAWVEYNKQGHDATFDTAKADYNKNKGDLQANTTIKELERQKEQNQDNLDNYIVTAPITGLVTTVNAQEGNGYQATTGALLTIQAVDVYEVTTQVDEYDINNVKIGQKVVIMTDATGKDELEGKVTFIAPTATAQQSGSTSTSNTFEVKIDIVKKDERLKLGMSAKLNILVDSHNNVLAVPYDAIEQKENGDTVIYIAGEGNAAYGNNDTAGSFGIQVIGKDGESVDDDDLPDFDPNGGVQLAETPEFTNAKKDAKEVKVQIGLEGDFYTEVISPEIKEGMTVLVDSKAGELSNEMDLMMGL